jgi:hypothetical protein
MLPTIQRRATQRIAKKKTAVDFGRKQLALTSLARALMITTLAINQAN